MTNHTNNKIGSNTLYSLFQRNVRRKHSPTQPLRNGQIPTFKLLRSERPNRNLIAHFPQTFPQSPFTDYYNETTYRVSKIEKKLEIQCLDCMAYKVTILQECKHCLITVILTRVSPISKKG